VRHSGKSDRGVARQRREGPDHCRQQRWRRWFRNGSSAHHTAGEKVLASYVGENKEFERQVLSGELDLELIPQGTLAERLRAGGAGIPGFYTRTGFGTKLTEGKETKVFDGKEYVLEPGITAELSLVKAWKGDKSGNLIFRKTSRNFNPMIASCGKVCVAEVEQLVEIGELDPDQIHTPGIFVDRIIQGESSKNGLSSAPYKAARPQKKKIRSAS